MLLNSFNDLICYFAWILLEINKVLRKSVITRVIGQHSLVNFFSLNACIKHVLNMFDHVVKVPPKV